jgi:transcriptional regulator with PAS, ATPase and Fis domain
MLKERERLAGNQKNLLDTMPEMVLLLNDGGAIEYSNPKAKAFFKKKSRGRLSKKKVIGQQLRSILQLLVHNDNQMKPIVATIADHPFECHLAPFSGYKGESLHWLIARELPEQTPAKADPGCSPDPLPKTMIGSSKNMRDLQDQIAMVSKTTATVLITGESGTGKELVANLIHQNSGQWNKPFLTINCNAINDSLLESDLFGYEKGSFTGATARRKGKFEAADQGTIFLDEIGDISPRMQSVLLRVLQNGEIIRVGGTSPLTVNVRVIAATNRDLAKAVQEGTFRLDLFYRLSIFKIAIPSLRHRKDDLLELTTHFIKKYRDAFKKDIACDPEAILSVLKSHDWPGNVRELQNIIQRAILMNNTNTLSAEDLIFDTRIAEQQPDITASILSRFNGTPLRGIVDQVEKEVIAGKLEKHNGNVAETALKLNISTATLYEKMKRHNIIAKSLR